MDRVGESANLAIRVGDHVRFIGSVECSQALRVGNREGMVFPAHLSSGGKLLLAGLPPAQLDSLYSDEKWAGRVDQRPALPALRRELATVREERGFALNREGTEAGVTAVGRGSRRTVRRSRPSRCRCPLSGSPRGGCQSWSRRWR